MGVCVGVDVGVLIESAMSPGACNTEQVSGVPVPNWDPPQPVTAIVVDPGTAPAFHLRCMRFFTDPSG